MITKEAALEKVKKAYPKVDFLIGTLCGNTYAFVGSVNGMVISGTYGIDAETGEPCYGVDNTRFSESMERNGFEV